MASETPDTPPEHDAQEPESFVGLAAEEAERRAYDHGWSTVRTVAPGAILTMEYLTGRLNLAVEDGTVVRCWKG
ncbi:I78 family peptidase inhibitor [Streptomyces sp. NPDC005438]|uniref:I78 family peptidase inhibitor n=1 Tax=Streptomyces sp. NPDC005438 TaxID=3156880 RepID=UPI0033B6AA7C